MRQNINSHSGTALSAVVFASLTSSIALTAGPVRAAAVAAQPAHNFVNSVGLGTYFGWNDSPYRTRYSEVKTKLAELGVRHIRDSVSGPGSASVFKNLYSTLGVRLLATVDLRTGEGARERLDPSQIKGHIDYIRTELGTAPLIGVEGPNEANLLERVHGYKGWPTDLRRFQEKLFSTVRADSAFAGKKVVQPSLAGPNSKFYYARMGDYSRISDVGNLHIYSNWLPWEHGAKREIESARQTMPGRPFWTSETGFHSAMNSGAQYLNRFTMLRYLPRALLGFGSYPGIRRSYLFQMVDFGPDPHKTNFNFNYGLIDYYGHVKPGFYAVRNMMHVLCDDPLRSAPGALRYALSGNLTDVRSLLYKKNNGAFYLVMWLEKPGLIGISATQSKDLINPPQAVTLKFEQGIDLVRRYEPGDPYGDVTMANNAKQSYLAPRSLNLSVRDSVMILEIVPTGVVRPAIKKSCAFKAT